MRHQHCTSCQSQDSDASAQAHSHQQASRHYTTAAVVVIIPSDAAGHEAAATAGHRNSRIPLHQEHLPLSLSHCVPHLSRSQEAGAGYSRRTQLISCTLLVLLFLLSPFASAVCCFPFSSLTTDHDDCYLRTPHTTSHTHQQPAAAPAVER